MATAGELLRSAAARLKAAAIDSPRNDAVLLLAHATGMPADRLRLDALQPVSPAAAAAFDALLMRRLEREPVSHILGRREFWSLEFVVSRDVLDPRPDSETLIATVLDRVQDRAAPLRIVDFGTGSGCLLLSLLHEFPHALGLGVDRSPAALAIAEGNALSLGLAGRARWHQGDWGEGLDESFDILISNPPYIATDEIPRLAPEVSRHEPRLALDGGPDGLGAYRVLIPQLGRLAAGEAVVALEIGQGQEAAVAAMLAGAGWQDIGVKSDLAGIGRVVFGCKPK
jgi:release factor glutamine methyltransferase